MDGYNARQGHGREPSALFYTHVSSRHAPYHTVAIPSSGEAAHVIDGLLYHEADLSIAVRHMDGGGVRYRYLEQAIFARAAGATGYVVLGLRRCLVPAFGGAG